MEKCDAAEGTTGDPQEDAQVRTVADFVTEVSPQKLMEHVGVGVRMIRYAVNRGLMPARWYLGALRAAQAAGVRPPEYHLFAFQVQSDEPHKPGRKLVFPTPTEEGFTSAENG